MNTNFFLNGVECKIGDKILSFGLDENCHKCVAVSTVCEWNEEENYYIVAEEGNPYRSRLTIVMKCWDGRISDAHNECWKYSAARKAEMEKVCENEYNAWRERVDAQIARARKNL